MLSREDLDELECAECKQALGEGKHAEHVAYLHSRCHVKEPLWVTYRGDGVLEVLCSKCGATVCSVLVGKREDRKELTKPTHLC